MIDAIAAAASAVGFLTPALAEIGKGAAGKLGGTGVEALLAWLRAKTTGRAKEALEDLEKHPDSGDNQADLRKQLAKLLTDDPALLAELAALLPAAKSDERMVQNITGSNNKAAQVKGDGNTTTIT
jgi:hypothetical protein